MGPAYAGLRSATTLILSVCPLARLPPAKSGLSTYGAFRFSDRAGIGWTTVLFPCLPVPVRTALNRPRGAWAFAVNTFSISLVPLAIGLTAAVIPGGKAIPGGTGMTASVMSSEKPATGVLMILTVADRSLPNTISGLSVFKTNNGAGLTAIAT